MGLEVIPVDGLPIFQEGDSFAEILWGQLDDAGIDLQQGDIIVIAQKVISKIEGRQVALESVEPSAEACRLAEEVEKDPRIVELILQESTDVVRKKIGVLIVRHRLGHVGANAGIDQSNIDHHSGGSALLLPVDPDRSAKGIREDLEKLAKVSLGVLITDSANRPWRLGTVGIAIGADNLMVLDDRRGGFDMYGRELKITLINRADSLAAAATLLMGETDEKIPVTIVRGAQSKGVSGQSSADMIRPLEDDLFR